MLTFPLPSDSQILTFTKDISSAPGLVEASKEGLAKNALMLTYLSTLSQATLAYKLRSFQMMCLTFRLMPLFLIEDSNIMLDPNSPKGKATE